MTSQQWHALAGLARRFTPDTPLHLTSRQDIEIHDLRKDQVPVVQQEMARAGLTGLGACGDTLRNVTVCPCSGLVRGVPDLEPLAWQIRKLLEAENGVYSLPRKFKISLSACEDGCAQPFINDLGLVAVELDGMWGFRVMAAGSLGARPATGIRIFDWLPAGEVLPLALAAIRVFAEHGDRTNRAKARLRHVRERMGNYPFVVLLKQALARARQERVWPMVRLKEGVKTYPAKMPLNFLGGDISPDAADALGRLAARPDTCLRISNHHQVVIFGTDAERLAAQVAGEPALAEAARPGPRIVVCPGSRWCKHGLTNTIAMGTRIREQLADALPPDTTICISGCPNGCSQHAVADFGLAGVLTTIDGVRREAYNLVVDGGMGRSDALARPMAQRLLPEHVVDRIAGKASQVSTPR